jgi:hypothetical protein
LRLKKALFRTLKGLVAMRNIGIERRETKKQIPQSEASLFQVISFFFGTCYKTQTKTQLFLIDLFLVSLLFQIISKNKNLKVSTLELCELTNNVNN